MEITNHERRCRQCGIALGTVGQPLVIVQLQDADGDPLLAAGAQGAHQREVRATLDIKAAPLACFWVAECRFDGAIEKSLNDPGVAAGGRAAKALAPPMIRLNVIDGADGDGPDAERIVTAAATLCKILAKHGFLLFHAKAPPRIRGGASGWVAVKAPPG